jgi:hypothetical protein
MSNLKYEKEVCMTQFKKLYMRPNLENQGSTPVTGGLCGCPDIWVAGDTPIVDYNTSLITPNSYAMGTPNSLVYKKDNYIYVRGKNGNESANVTNNVTLYYADASLIQWPSKWQNNKIGTDQGPDHKGQIVNVKPNEIGVADRPFVWIDVPPQPSNSHYCLIAQFNDDNNSNPFPSVFTCLDMAKLVSNNIQWGWRNVTVCDNHENVEFSYKTNLDVPIDIQEPERRYLLYLQPGADLVGFQISFMGSQPDSQGNKIEMKKSRVEQGGQILGCECILKRGFTSMISVYLYNPDHKPIPTGASLPFTPNYFPSKAELKSGNALHLYNRELTGLICKQMNLKNVNNDQAIVALGGYRGIIK